MESFPKEHRPWEWLESLIKGSNFQVKTIYVKVGRILSLQKYKYRSEHWVVVGVKAQVTIDGKVKILNENESIYIPVGSKHRLENKGKLLLKIIEIRTGSY